MDVTNNKTGRGSPVQSLYNSKGLKKAGLKQNDLVNQSNSESKRSSDSVKINDSKTGFSKSDFFAMEKLEYQVLFRLNPKVASNQQKLADIYAKSNPIEKPENPKEDYYSPENTSDRIVNFATSLFSAFKSDAPEDDAKKQEFIEKIKGAIDQGFKEAKKMLGALPDEVENKINKTYDLVQEKLLAWEKGESKGYNEKLSDMTTNVIKDNDKDTDGLLSREESGLFKEEFLSIDKNQDGFLSEEELINSFKDKDTDRNLVLDNMDQKYARFRDAIRDSEENLENPPKV